MKSVIGLKVGMIVTANVTRTGHPTLYIGDHYIIEHIDDFLNNITVRPIEDKEKKQDVYGWTVEFFDIIDDNCGDCIFLCRRKEGKCPFYKEKEK